MDELAEENYADFEPLPALLEDEENVSLADVLSLRDSCLTEQDIWAVCLECSQSLKSIAHSAIFQTLCITPDTLAFNTNGNVCFMEQISDDPEGVFMSPEIDITGNTFEAHVFSLGATLQAVIEYMMKMETESEISQDLHTLLKQMQEENPKERPNIEAVISLCKEKLKLSSSNDICRCLSAVGRRTLSIESCDRFQESCDNLWDEEVYKRMSPYEQPKDKGIRQNSSPEDKEADGSRTSGVYNMNEQNNGTSKIKINFVNERFCCQQNYWLQTKVTKYNTGNSSEKPKIEAKPHRSELGRDLFKKNCLKKVKTCLTLPLEFETNFTKQNGSLARKYNQVQPRLLFVTGNQEHSVLSQCGRSNLPGSKVAYFQESSSNLEESSPESSCLSRYNMVICNEKKADIPPLSHVVSETLDNRKPNESPSCYSIQKNYKTWEYSGENTPGSNEDFVLCAKQRSTVFTEFDENGCHSEIRFPEHNCSERNGYCVEDIPYESRESEMKSNEQVGETKPSF